MTAKVDAPQATATPKTPAPDSQRAANGRFRKGNRGGPGNPFARQCARLRQAALDAVTEEEMRAVIDALKKKALEGDVAAIKLLLSYTIGKPTAPVEPDTLDKHELNSLLDYHTNNSETMLRILNGVPADFVLQMLQAILPKLVESQRKQAHQVVTAPETPEEDDEPEGEPIVSDGGVAPGLERFVHPQRQVDEAGSSLNLAAVERQLHELLERAKQNPAGTPVEVPQTLLDRLRRPMTNGSNGKH